jgi:hypothetical protein
MKNSQGGINPFPLSEMKGIVSLTGGLGNQLFQYAAAIHLFKNNFEVVSTLGKPRLSKTRNPEIQDFNLPFEQISEITKEGNWIEQKCSGYLLRSSIYPKGLEKYRLFRIATFTVAQLILSLHCQRLVRIVTENLAQANKIRPKSCTSYLAIGYFQKYFWANTFEVKNQLMQLKPRFLSNVSKDLLREAQSKRILIVHVRRGDYRNESFGLLDNHYYSTSITSAFQKANYSEIWIFSDEHNNLIDVVPENYKNLARVIDDSGLTSVEVLECMRHGSGYVIANSTFSWWGAFLSYSTNPHVFAPDPWFKNRQSHQDLCLPNWIKIERN